MQELGRIISKYLFPILLIAIGAGLLLIAGGQTNFYIYGGIGILAVGIISFLYVKGIISGTLQTVLVISVALGAAYLAYKDYDVIQDRLAYEKKRQKIENHVIQRLKDIRKAQVAYKEENEQYTPSFDSLLYFIKNGRISIIKRLGSLPDSVPTDEQAREMGILTKMPEGMDDQEVIAKGLIVRDTIKVNAKSYIYDEDDRENREAKLYVDSLPYVPYADHKFDMRTDVIESGGVKQSVFKVVDPKPFDKKFMVGSLTEASTNGNWSQN